MGEASDHDAGGVSEQALLDRVRAGGSAGEHAFGVLYFRYRDFALRVALRVTRDDALAQDAVQDVFFALVKRARGRRLVLRGTLGSYLYPAVRRAALRAVRKHAVVGEGGREVETDAARGDEGERGALVRAMEGLTEVQRESLVLHYVEGMTLAEVGRAMGCPEGTVKSRVNKALAALRGDERLRGLFEGE